MRTKLVAIGSSLGVIIDKPILELLHITSDTEIDISTDGAKLVLTPIHFATREQTMEAYENIAKRHAESFKKLAE